MGIKKISKFKEFALRNVANMIRSYKENCEEADDECEKVIYAGIIRNLEELLSNLVEFEAENGNK